jgi:uncharacterized protein YjbI with pentapeptide repeats
MKPAWKKYLLYGSVVVVTGIFLLLLEETIRLRNTGFEGKTLWEWMELLIIPLVLAIGAFALNSSERKTEREIAADRQREASLQAYFDKMADLLITGRLQASEDEGVLYAAKIRTLTVMRQLDGRRNKIVLGFIKDLTLYTLLESADLSHTDFRNANFRGLSLTYSNFSFADLSGADLHEVNLSSATLISTNLSDSNPEFVDLTSANLQDANLQNANLHYSRLNFAKLQGAILGGCNLQGSDLTGTRVSNKQLATAKSLSGATMPDGTKHD